MVRFRSLLALALIAPGCSQIAGIGDKFAAGEPNDAGDTVDAVDALEPCECVGSTLSCPGGETLCAATCLDQPDPHCALLIPSNAVDRALLAQVSTKITFGAATVIDTSTGAITGGITRAAGTGVESGIGYSQLGTLGVFVFDELEISAAVTVRVIGTRPAVLLVGKTVRVTGIIDASGNQTARTQAGPGGGTGAQGATVAGGCAPGGAGKSAGTLSDSGGGGGGGAAAGGSGGQSGTAQVGAGGTACIPLTLEPLVGGSGGGIGAGGDAVAARGGGGGGALQISSLEQIIITGTIDIGGAGGEAGQGDTNTADGTNAGAGGGGGGGGALLLEAPVVTVNAGAVLAANGGGGGGAGNDQTDGTSGQDGQRSATVALGGQSAISQASDGGDGGANTTAAKSAANSSTASYNAGGGGGAVGRIFVRAHASPALGGTISPPASVGTFRMD